MHTSGQEGTGNKPDSASDRCVACIIAALGLVLILAAKFAPRTESAPMSQPWLPATPSVEQFDPSPFILNALVVSALDADALPLRWVDPRPAMACGPEAKVMVNGEPLQPGAEVPVAAFEMEWQTDGCRPFGLAGPTFDGAVKLSVFREDFGFSAIVEPSTLRIALAENRLIPVARSAATLPQNVDAGEFAESPPPGAD